MARTRLAAIGLLAAAAGLAFAGQAAPPLRVCADPDNLPFSHQDGSGFENRIAELLARELGRSLQYAWLPDRRGFVRKTLGAGLCDLMIQVPEGFERTHNTRPYYRSAYVLVDRAGPEPPPVAWDDPRLARLRLGVQLVGDDMAATPPGHALARQGLTANVTGVPVGGQPSSAQRLVEAVARGELDAAYIWGPQAGWFAARSEVALRVTPVAPAAGLPLPVSYAMSIGVRRGDEALRQAVDEVLLERRAEIRAILARYAVPLQDEEAGR